MAILGGMDCSGIIDSLGGNAALAGKLGENPRSVWRWRRRGIPARYWHRIVEIAEAAGIEGVTIDHVARPLWQRPAPEQPSIPAPQPARFHGDAAG